MRVPIPSDNVLNGVKRKKIYKFSNNELTTSIPHYFVCIIREDKDNAIMVCCTSQIEKATLHADKTRTDYNTLVIVSPSKENNLSVDTLINCNTIFDCKIEDFRTKYEQGEFVYVGEITDAQYEQLLIGLHNSRQLTKNQKKKIPISG